MVCLQITYPCNNGISILEHFIRNDPLLPEEYREFRRVVLHLQCLDQNRQLFVKAFYYEHVVRAKLAGPSSGATSPRPLRRDISGDSCASKKAKNA